VAALFASELLLRVSMQQIVPFFLAAMWLVVGCLQDAVLTGAELVAFLTSIACVV
jgi:hypothetical protein